MNYFKDDLQWFMSHPLRRYRVRLAYEGEAQEYAALYFKATGGEMPPSVYPAYAAVFRLPCGGHARQVFYSGSDFTCADEQKAQAIFDHVARGVVQ